jgi:glycerol-3-phosphate dehydrogenase
LSSVTSLDALIHGALPGGFQWGGQESLHDRRAWRTVPGCRSAAVRHPVYKEDSRPAWYIHTGLKLYGMLSRDAELGTCQRISADEVEHLEPGLDRKNLKAAFRYFDCQATYPEKLCVEMALRAETAGATVRNHSPVSGFIRDGSRVAGVRCGEEEFRGKLVVNAAGAWVDEVRTLLSPENKSRPVLSRLNGAHIVARPFPGAPQNAVYHEARSDKRPFFIVPGGGSISSAPPKLRRRPPGHAQRTRDRVSAERIRSAVSPREPQAGGPVLRLRGLSSAAAGELQQHE